MTEGLYSKCSSYMFPHYMERAGVEIRSNIYLCTAIIHDIDVHVVQLYFTKHYGYNSSRGNRLVSDSFKQKSSSF